MIPGKKNLFWEKRRNDEVHCFTHPSLAGSPWRMKQIFPDIAESIISERLKRKPGRHCRRMNFLNPKQ
jgi:hypothetical protein